MRDWDATSKKPPKGAGQAVLYLDFDGVLHHESVFFNKKGPYIKTNSAGWGQCPYVLFQHAPLLVELLAPYPAVKIVLSTSWARVYGCYGAAKRLPVELRERVIGATFHSRMNEAEFISQSRGMQIWNDVYRRNPRVWFALDDDWFGWPKWCLDNYVRTDVVLGISAPAVRDLIVEKLREISTLSNGAPTSESNL